MKVRMKSRRWAAVGVASAVAVVASAAGAVAVTQAGGDGSLNAPSGPPIELSTPSGPIMTNSHLPESVDLDSATYEADLAGTAFFSAKGPNGLCLLAIVREESLGYQLGCSPEDYVAEKGQFTSYTPRGGPTIGAVQFAAVPDAVTINGEPVRKPARIVPVAVEAGQQAVITAKVGGRTISRTIVGDKDAPDMPGGSPAGTAP